MMSGAVIGSLLGTAVGDALGLPYEGLGARRAARLLGRPDRYRFLFGRGMVSDDTDHACIVAQALVRSRLDPDRFGRELAWGLRWWLLGLPAGVGFGTIRAIGKLLIGFDHNSSGVGSAGNGPAMRSAVIGAAIDDLSLLARLVRISTRITHTDPRAEWAAHAVALAAHEARHGTVDAGTFLDLLVRELNGDASPFLVVVERAIASVKLEESAPLFCAREGHRDAVSGFALHSIPVALHIWLRHQDDVVGGIEEAIRCGGDTDTVAAMVGGITGSATGVDGLPSTLIDGLIEWPRSPRWIKSLGQALEDVVAGEDQVPCPGVPAVGVLLRNALFMVVVLMHGLRRILPPY